jgi:predicted phage terminase large subunit-like protein
VSVTPAGIERARIKLKVRTAFDPWDGPNGTARENQRPPDGNWRTWLIMAGRGFGKTRTGAEYIRKQVMARRMERVAIVGPTAADVRDVMIEGESGLLACCDRAGIIAKYNPSRRRVQFGNGAVAFTYSADEPNRLRGPQHDGFWADEIAAWRYIDAWDQLQFGLRLGDDPRGVATTTPRPIRLVRQLIAAPTTTITRGSTYDNRANLAPAFFEQIITKYEGTTLGRQELMGELVEDVEGALWKRTLIEDHRAMGDLPDLTKIAVAIDPATTFGEDSDETGISVAGIDAAKDVYVLHGSGHRESPQEWATRALRLYTAFDADQIVAESNQGGEMVKQTIIHAARDMGMSPIPRIVLIHASRGKRVRAEPVVALYEQGKVHHVGMFGTLEDQMCTFPLIDEDDQVDALVHAITAVAPAQRRGGGAVGWNHNL